MTKRKNESQTINQLESEVYGSDVPASDPKQDRFGRIPFAQRVAQTLASRRDPSSIVIAIHGAWGEGKTTVLAYIELELQKFYPEVVCVRFNPWRFTDEGALLTSFFETVGDTLARSLTTGKERVGKVLREYGKLLGLSFEYGGGKLAVGDGIETLGAYWSATSLDEKKLRVEEVLREEGRRVVILIDDIDRLEQSEIRQIFKLVKLTGDFEYTSYVLAFDPEMVARALGEKYGAGAASDGASFLEKIVQVPLNLPAADPADLQDYCFEHVNEALRVAQFQLPAESRLKFDMAFDQYFVPVLGTPRTAKRYANALAFIMPLLAGEVNPLDVMLLEALKIFYPSLHAAIRESPDRFTGSMRFRTQDVRERDKLWMQQLLENSAADRLIKELFPLVAGILRDGKFDSGDEVEWGRQQRVASREYLRRYLACTVPRADISDKQVDELIAELKGLSQRSASDRFLAFISGTPPRKLLWKLRIRVEQMDEQFSRHLALTIASSGEGVPRSTDLNALGSPLSSAAFLIRVLLARIEDANGRLEAAAEVVKTATPLTFARVCFQAMGPQRGDLDVFIQDVSKLETLLAGRIAEFARGASVFKAFPTGIDGLLLLLQWQRTCGSEVVHDYFRRVLESDPQEGVVLVRSQLGLYVAGAVNDFQIEHYQNLALLADPQDVDAALTRVDTSELAPQYAKLISQFKVLHEQQKKTPPIADAV